MLANERAPQQIEGYASHTRKSDVARGVKYIDSRKFFIRKYLEKNINARFLFTCGAPTWGVAVRVAEYLESDHPALEDISKDRHMVAYLYNNMGARAVMKRRAAER